MLSRGGSASYLTPSEIHELRSRGKRGILLMHYAPGEFPITGDLDHILAAQSLAASSDLASEQTYVGRFVVSRID